jgi:hypothetical protein
MMHLDLLASIASFALILYLYIRRQRIRANYDLPLPPGPKKLPLIGNLLDMPAKFEWETYHKWCKEFGTFVNSK